jgi:hypothetical protein
VAVSCFVRGLGGGAAWRTLSLGSFALALLSKESAVASVLVLVVTSAALLPPGSATGPRPAAAWARGVLRPLLGHWLVLAGYLLVRWAALGTPIGGYGAEVYAVSPLDHLVHLGAAIGRSVLPAAGWPWWVLAAVLLIVGGGVVAFVSARARRSGGSGGAGAPGGLATLSLFAAGSVVASLLPVATLGVSPFDPSGERHVYLASAFASVLVATGWTAVRMRSRAAAWTIAAMAVALCAVVSHREAVRWNEASRASMAVIERVRTIDSSRPVLLVNLPDSVRGAAGLRNATAGIEWVAPGRGDGIVSVVSSRRFTDIDERASVRLSEDRTVLTVSSGTSGEGVTGTADVVDVGPWTVHDTGPGAHRIEFDEPVDPSSIWYFSAGRLHSLG